MNDEQMRVLKLLKAEPVRLGHMLGFTKLERIHNDWIRDMVFGSADETLQAHRGSYKTTCVSIALADIMILYPNDKTMFNRKTDTDVVEVMSQVKKIIDTGEIARMVNILYGIYPGWITEQATQLTLNLAANDPRGTAQLLGMGIKGSITGKHFDRIFTDDIINKDDRISKAEREKTKLFYQELQNVKNRGGRIFNTGTPWHKEDAFTLMPNPKVYDCYQTGLITTEELDRIRSSMTASLFAANYEMRHIAADDVIFRDPTVGRDASLVEQGECHLDAAYGGQDYTAFTICRKAGGKYYVYGRLWRKHVDDVQNDIIRLRKRFNAGRISCEDNADKGYLKKELRSKGERVHGYHESMNKFVKITSYLKAAWKDVEFVEGTDKEYINQVCDYNVDAEHDDAPDSLASMVRILWNKSDPAPDTNAYTMFL